MGRVTAFVTTIGGSTFDACMERLRGQVPVVVLDRIAPFSAALQAMADRAETELYLQIDEDMLVDPDAVARMVAHVDATSRNTVMVVAPLWDVELGQAIYGLKAYRRDLVRRVPFEDHSDGDVHDRRRWQEAGLAWSKVPRRREHCVGLHGTHYTPEEAFTRWRRLMMAARRSPAHAWTKPWPARLRRRYEASGSRRDLFAMLGAAIGATERADQHGGPDFRRADPALARLAELFPE